MAEENLIERLEGLEKQLRRWKITVIAGGLGIAALAGGALAVSLSKRAFAPNTAPRVVIEDEVAAHRFVVIDDHQKPHADFGFFGDSPRLALYDEKADASIELNFAGGVLPPIPDLSGSTPAHVRTQTAVPVVYVDEKDKRGSLKAAALSLDSDPGFDANLNAYPSGASLMFTDSREHDKAFSEMMKSGKMDYEKLSAIQSASLNLSVDKDTSAHVSLTDKHGKIRGLLRTDAGGSPSLALYDENDHPRSVLSGSAGFLMADKSGKMRAMLATDAEGSPSLVLNDEKEHSRTVLGNVGLENTKTGSTENTGPSSLVLFGKDGKVIWRAP